LETLWVRGQYDMLLRAVVNVLDNAVKYSPPNSHIVVRLARWGEMAGISVVDQGIGIPEHALPRLFELFYQVDEGRGDGAGLGLPFVKAVMQAHGGGVEVKSRSRLGSEFLLLAPWLESGVEES
jgi:signal transduction histidine kinase